MVSSAEFRSVGCKSRQQTFLSKRLCCKKLFLALFNYVKMGRKELSQTFKRMHFLFVLCTVVFVWLHIGGLTRLFAHNIGPMYFFKWHIS